jgi:hypothetical protein
MVKQRSGTHWLLYKRIALTQVEKSNLKQKSEAMMKSGGMGRAQILSLQAPGPRRLG